MIIDEVNKLDNNKLIEIYIKDGDIGVWIPAMATDLRILNRDNELVRVKGLRVRKLQK